MCITPTCIRHIYFAIIVIVTIGITTDLENFYQRCFQTETRNKILTFNWHELKEVHSEDVVELVEHEGGGSKEGHVIVDALHVDAHPFVANEHVRVPELKVEHGHLVHVPGRRAARLSSFVNIYRSYYEIDFLPPLINVLINNNMQYYA